MKSDPTFLDPVHHVAVTVRDVAEAVLWYTDRFSCEVEYQDATWAMLAFANIRLALMAPGRHPPHVGFARGDAGSFGALATHRDGTRSAYVEDPSGNAVEILDERSLE
jgi:catechol 2,3-dioxygenase-like lactoylglutathione lyase family enzyme